MGLTVRRIALAGSGLTFLGIALFALAAPRLVAAQYGYPLDRPEAFNEFRAVFTGFWLGLAVALFTAARRPELTLLGDLCGVMIGLQACGRLVSFALDGFSGARFAVAAALELGTAAVILVGRKRAP
jgi:hypothetical protein